MPPTPPPVGIFQRSCSHLHLAHSPRSIKRTVRKRPRRIEVQRADSPFAVQLPQSTTRTTLNRTNVCTGQSTETTVIGIGYWSMREKDSGSRDSPVVSRRSVENGGTRLFDLQAGPSVCSLPCEEAPHCRAQALAGSSVRAWPGGTRQAAPSRLRVRSPSQRGGSGPDLARWIRTQDLDPTTDHESPLESVDLDESAGHEGTGSGGERPGHIDDCENGRSQNFHTGLASFSPEGTYCRGVWCELRAEPSRRGALPVADRVSTGLIDGLLFQAP